MLFIVIPVHNRAGFTRSCLESLSRQNTSGFRVIIVNDGCTDETEEIIKREFPETLMLYGDGNLWWTRATNLGVKYALELGADYVMTLNDDTIAPPDFVEKMLFWARQKPEALLGALAIDAKTHKIIYAGEKINWRSCSYEPLRINIDFSRLKGIHEITHFPGRGLLIPAKVFEKIGLYDEVHFPHYAADYDFTHRAIRAGFKVYCNYEAKLSIFPNASGGVELRKTRSARNYYQHLFGIKGAANLKVFTYYALRNCPRRYLPFFLTQGYVRRILGYWL